jgi:hypothetical protein
MIVHSILVQLLTTSGIFVGRQGLLGNGTDTNEESAFY